MGPWLLKFDAEVGFSATWSLQSGFVPRKVAMGRRNELSLEYQWNPPQVRHVALRFCRRGLNPLVGCDCSKIGERGPDFI